MASKHQTSYPFQSLLACNRCKKAESELRVSLRPCHGCRGVVYCSQKCREVDAENHDCKQTVSETETFGRNCYILHSLSRNAEETIEMLTPLTKYNTDKLLQKAIHDTRVRRARSEETFTQAVSWNPNLAQLFAVKDAPFSQAPLRMLHSTTKSDPEDKKDSVDSFIAVSYSWPTPEWPPDKDFIELRSEGKQIPISKIFWNFLLDMRESEQEGIWIDQICLDQNDDVEKVSAIASMDALYASARLVFIVLEDVTLTHREFTVLSDGFRKTSADRHWVFEFENAQELFNVVTKLFSARWFTRAWCFHEYHMTRDRIIAVRVETPRTKGTTSVVGLVNLGDFIYRLPYFENEQLRQANAETVRNMLRFFAGQGSAYSNIIANTFSYRAKFLRDKMSITINLIRLGVSANKDVIPEDDKHEDEGCMSVLMLALAAGDGTILTTRGVKLRFGEDLQKISWFQWPDETGWSSRHEIPKEHGIFAVNAEYIDLNLYFLDEYHFRSASTGALARAEEFLSSEFAGHIRTAYGLGGIQAVEGAESQSSSVQESQASNTKKGSAHDLGEGSILETLACGLECGHSWMIKAWPRIQDEVGPEVDENYPLIEYLAAAIERSLFPDDTINLGQLANASTVLKFVTCLLLFGKYWEIGTWVSTSAAGDMGLSDVRKEESLFRVPLASEHKLYEHPTYSFYSRSNTRLAIPQAMASDTFCMSDRVWLLEPVKESGGNCWRVKDKVALIGCAAIHEDGKIAILKKNQRVIG